MKHLLTYVEDCSPKIKTFKTEKAMDKFINRFYKKHGKTNDGFWIDLKITDIKGRIQLMSDWSKE